MDAKDVSAPISNKYCLSPAAKSWSFPSSLQNITILFPLPSTLYAPSASSDEPKNKPCWLQCRINTTLPGPSLDLFLKVVKTSIFLQISMPLRHRPTSQKTSAGGDQKNLVSEHRPLFRGGASFKFFRQLGVAFLSEAGAALTFCYFCVKAKVKIHCEFQIFPPFL